MKFRLTYSGPLAATQGAVDPKKPGPKAALKHEIRRAFHPQLRWHWTNNAFLSTHWVTPTDYGLPANFEHNGTRRDRAPLPDVLAAVHKQGAFSFVPLVRHEWKLLCELEVLLLRHDPPGSAGSAGDVDNRVKTLVDALTLPNPSQMASDAAPSADEKPFYCLLEDDVLLSKLTVESDRLLRPPLGRKPEHQREVQAVITVNVRPYSGTLFNIGFLS